MPLSVSARVTRARFPRVFFRASLRKCQIQPLSFLDLYFLKRLKAIAEQSNPKRNWCAEVRHLGCLYFVLCCICVVFSFARLPEELNLSNQRFLKQCCRCTSMSTISYINRFHADRVPCCYCCFNYFNSQQHNNSEKTIIIIILIIITSHRFLSTVVRVIRCYVILASYGKTRATQYRVYCILCSNVGPVVQLYNTRKNLLLKGPGHVVVMFILSGSTSFTTCAYGQPGIDNHTHHFP